MVGLAHHLIWRIVYDGKYYAIVYKVRLAVHSCNEFNAWQAKANVILCLRQEWFHLKYILEM